MTASTSAVPAPDGVGTLDSVVLDVPDLTAEADFWKAQGFRVFADPAGHPFCLVH